MNKTSYNTHCYIHVCKFIGNVIYKRELHINYAKQFRSSCKGSRFRHKCTFPCTAPRGVDGTNKTRKLNLMISSKSVYKTVSLHLVHRFWKLFVKKNLMLLSAVNIRSARRMLTAFFCLFVCVFAWGILQARLLIALILVNAILR